MSSCHAGVPALSGLFVVLEGLDGSGKSTQALHLCRYFEEHHQKVFCLKEPGGTPLGEQVRKIFLDPAFSIDPLTELLLIEASRHELVKQVIDPALKQGAVVVCQRYTYSSLAYQGYGRGLPLNWIEDLNEKATRGLKPDIVFYLDLSAKQALKRMESRESRDRMEGAGSDFLIKVEAGYQNLLKQYPEMIRVDGSLEETILTNKLINLIEDH